MSKQSFSHFIDKLFAISERKTTIKTEIMAGFITFLAMVYIIFVNPQILAAANVPLEAAIAATIWTAALCSIAMGLYAKLPLAMAPGMGINAFFSFYVCGTLGVHWTTALGVVFISGIIFLILSITKMRQLIIDSIPSSLKSAIAVGIGMFICLISLQTSGIVVSNPSTIVSLGNLTEPKAFLTIIGLIITATLVARNVKGAMLIGILIITILSMILGVSKIPDSIESIVSLNIPSIAETFMMMDLIGALSYSLISVIFTFIMVELFDNIGTLIAVTRAANLVDEKGKIKNVDEALLTDSVGTMFSALCGTCTVTSYVESSAGVNAGGRTGLVAVVVGILFLLTLFFSPLVSLVPPQATAPILIIVGAMMVTNIKYINFNDFSETVPAFLTIIMMPLSYSIANGFGFGFISYCCIKLFMGKGREVSPLMWIISILFAISFSLHLA